MVGCTNPTVSVVLSFSKNENTSNVRSSPTVCYLLFLLYSQYNMRSRTICDMKVLHLSVHSPTAKGPHLSSRQLTFISLKTPSFPEKLFRCKLVLELHTFSCPFLLTKSIPLVGWSCLRVSVVSPSLRLPQH